MLTFDSAKLPENITAGYKRLSVRTYIPNPLRCFQCQRFDIRKRLAAGHSPAPVVQKSGMKLLIAPVQRSVLTDNISTHQSALKPFATTKPTSVDTELLLMAILPPLEKILLQSRESDAYAEMSSSSLLEEDAIEYNMSEDLEDSPAVISPPPSSKPEKANKYKNR
ncbi:hypothetical protein AVEN_34359-1 [Araneus ventricosus]|uniref:Uncharacterized protein n=1 Tax=Araneus ventricosus TaxID=182803 RepID=A0A4Y2G5Z0_ARAVE|nr:hypothetical protein AVEN_34359-1 [Araneus ventricosus]